jgi:hypothetical protein
MGTLPKDRHNDRPGATHSEHDGSFSRRAMLAGTVAATAAATIAPISGSACAAGPDVSSPQDMMAFLLLSEALTGVDRQLLAPELEPNKVDVLSSKPGTDPINIKNDYFRWINGKDSTSSFATLLKFVKDNPKSSPSDIIGFVNTSNDDIKFLARSIVLLVVRAEGSAKASGQTRSHFLRSRLPEGVHAGNDLANRGSPPDGLQQFTVRLLVPRSPRSQ